MAISVSVQGVQWWASPRHYNVDPILLPLETRLNPMKNFFPNSQCSHKSVLTFSPLNGWMFRITVIRLRLACLYIFLTRSPDVCLGNDEYISYYFPSIYSVQKNEEGHTSPIGITVRKHELKSG